MAIMAPFPLIILMQSEITLGPRGTSHLSVYECVSLLREQQTLTHDLCDRVQRKSKIVCTCACSMSWVHMCASKFLSPTFPELNHRPPTSPYICDVIAEQEKSYKPSEKKIWSEHDSWSWLHLPRLTHGWEIESFRWLAVAPGIRQGMRWKSILNHVHEVWDTRQRRDLIIIRIWTQKHTVRYRLS